MSITPFSKNPNYESVCGRARVRECVYLSMRIPQIEWNLSYTFVQSVWCNAHFHNTLIARKHTLCVRATVLVFGVIVVVSVRYCAYRMRMCVFAFLYTLANLQCTIQIAKGKCYVRTKKLHLSKPFCGTVESVK